MENTRADRLSDSDMLSKPLFVPKGSDVPPHLSVSQLVPLPATQISVTLGTHAPHPVRRVSRLITKDYQKEKDAYKEKAVWCDPYAKIILPPKVGLITLAF
ncbi:uncharacterized protein RSE6_02976 [Rhynchosporium secalis]|uniref:Uncharacterized protein n=1 Tax=Rhynchosporium secalis TaxID=38038 RepID=A0A1E1M1N0_RHYSE|nr:uncharacterized protein RSE6_02976 [Rhynchosporium secalis]